MFSHTLVNMRYYYTGEGFVYYDAHTVAVTIFSASSHLCRTVSCMA